MSCRRPAFFEIWWYVLSAESACAPPRGPLVSMCVSFALIKDQASSTHSPQSRTRLETRLSQPSSGPRAAHTQRPEKRNRKRRSTETQQQPARAETRRATAACGPRTFACDISPPQSARKSHVACTPPAPAVADTRPRARARVARPDTSPHRAQRPPYLLIWTFYCSFFRGDSKTQSTVHEKREPRERGKYIM